MGDGRKACAGLAPAAALDAFRRRPPAPGVRGRVAKAHLLNKERAPYVFVAPFFILFGIFMVWPILYSVWLSLHDVRQLTRFTYVGFGNYLNLVQDARFHRALANTTYFAVAMGVFNVSLGFLFSLLLTARSVPGTRAARLSLFLPTLVSTVIAGAVFRLMLMDTPGGLLNHLIGYLGIAPQNWLDDNRWALKSVIALAFWRSIGLSTVYFIGGLQGLPSDLYEAARIDGASPWQQLRYLTVPLMRPIIAFVSTVTLIESYLVFTEVYVLSPAGIARDNVVSLGYFLWESAFRFFRLGYGAAVGCVMTLIIVVLSIVQLKVLGVFRSDD